MLVDWSKLVLGCDAADCCMLMDGSSGSECKARCCSTLQNEATHVERLASTLPELLLHAAPMLHTPPI